MITRKEWIKNLDKGKRRKILFYVATQSTWRRRWWCHYESVKDSGLTIGGLLNPCPEGGMEEVFPLKRCFWNEEEAEAELGRRNA